MECGLVWRGKAGGGVTSGSGRPAKAFCPVTFTVEAATEHLQF